jgi:hypothetical protein
VPQRNGPSKLRVTVGRRILDISCKCTLVEHKSRVLITESPGRTRPRSVVSGTSILPVSVSPGIFVGDCEVHRQSAHLYGWDRNVSGPEPGSGHEVCYEIKKTTRNWGALEGESV